MSSGYPHGPMFSRLQADRNLLATAISTRDDQWFSVVHQEEKSIRLLRVLVGLHAEADVYAELESGTQTTLGKGYAVDCSRELPTGVCLRLSTTAVLEVIHDSNLGNRHSSPQSRHVGSQKRSSVCESRSE